MILDTEKSVDKVIFVGPRTFFATSFITLAGSLLDSSLPQDLNNHYLFSSCIYSHLPNHFAISPSSHDLSAMRQNCLLPPQEGESITGHLDRPRMGFWIRNPEGGADFYADGGGEDILTVSQNRRVRWWREIPGYPDKVAWMEYDYLSRVTSRQEWNDMVDECYRVNAQLRANDPDRNKPDFYEILGPLERPKQRGPWQIKEKEIIRPSLEELPGANTWPWLQRTKIPRPTPLTAPNIWQATRRKHKISDALMQSRPNILERRKALLQQNMDELAIDTISQSWILL